MAATITGSLRDPQRLPERACADCPLRGWYRSSIQVPTGDLQTQNYQGMIDGLTGLLQKEGVCASVGRRVQDKLLAAYPRRSVYAPDTHLEIDLGYQAAGGLGGVTGQVEVTRAEVRDQTGNVVETL